jgi:hypothetical protein
MKAQGMTDKERALLEAARREAAARKAAKPAPSERVAPAAAPLDGRTVIGWDHPAANTTPLDAPTVAGWDHPAAQAGPAALGAKWERIAALMEAEREASRERQRRVRRAATIALGVLLVVVLFAGARILAR